jgi:hypothetical protein
VIALPAITYKSISTKTSPPAKEDSVSYIQQNSSKIAYEPSTDKNEGSISITTCMAK